MKRGELRVYLGAAPGAGKTYRMLDEGWRRRARGADVVVAFVETHGRVNTEEQLRDLEVIPRKLQDYRDTIFGEMDLDAVLARNPRVALVDELAHTNVPGCTNEKRWQDVEQLLDAGIDVITTVNIQHLESVNDVVEQITGIAQNETIPDYVVRRAKQIELVDITPEALRRRLAHGNVYAADKIDASLSNYFRVGNLTALREIALMWVAERVEDALESYRDDHGITSSWETRERLIVAVTGGPGDEVLLRRAARMASRTGGELLAVHVQTQQRSSDNSIIKTRNLVVELGGTLQEIVDEEIAPALVSFTRAHRGTQLIIGTGRKHTFWRVGKVEQILRLARGIDVHVISITEVRPSHLRRRRRKRRVSLRRQVVTGAVASASLVLLTAGLVPIQSSVSNSTVFLCFLVVVLGTSVVGGVFVGTIAAVFASGLENYYFVPPEHSLTVAHPDDVVALIAFLLFAVGASLTANKFIVNARDADQARAQAAVLARTAAMVVTTHEDLVPLLESMCALFTLDGAALRKKNGDAWLVVVSAGVPIDEQEVLSRFTIDEEHEVVLQGHALEAIDRDLVSAFASRVGSGLQAQALQREASELLAQAEADALRTGLLRAVSHDLRTPLATIQANVSTLLEQDVTWTADEAHAFLLNVEREVHRLTRLVTNLLDAGRLEAKVVTPRFIEVDIEDIIASALETIDTRGRHLEITIEEGLPQVSTDPDLVERVVANLVANACRFSPLDEPVRIIAGATTHTVDVLVIDRGPGIAVEKRAHILEPFQRLSDDEVGSGLGLTVVKGFLDLIGGVLLMDDTPSGGLTVAVSLPRRVET